MSSRKQPLPQVKIPRDSLDPFQRYRRSVLQPQTKRGNLTCIPIKDVETLAKELNRPAASLMHMFKRQFRGAAFEKGGFVHLQGEIGGRQLDDAVEDYIERCVLCSVCANPETYLPSAESRRFTCKACGEQTRAREE